jgi:hypothetical protein
MDEADRIPIDVGYEVASAANTSDPRTTVKEDGTVVINILAPQPCEPEPSTESEIVVCAESPEGGPNATPPQIMSPMDMLGEALSAKVGPLELGSIDRGDGSRVFGARIRF